jgi:hypothetical protein
VALVHPHGNGPRRQQRLVLATGGGGESLGALNLYSRSEQGYSSDDEETGLLFAAQASVALANAKVYWSARAPNEQLREALASRDVIGQAKGIIMAESGGDGDHAFDVLRRASQRETRSCVTWHRTWGHGQALRVVESPSRHSTCQFSRADGASCPIPSLGPRSFARRRPSAQPSDSEGGCRLPSRRR